MNAIRVFVTLAVILPTLLCSQTNASQSQNNQKQSPVSEMDKLDEGSYLDRAHFSRKIEKLKSEGLQNILFLGIIVENFGSQVDGAKSDLDKLKSDYQTALRYYYRNRIIAAGRKMTQVNADARKLFGKFSDFYEQRTDALLTECSDQIVTLEENQQMNSSFSEDGRYKELFANHHKLRIAYYQMTQAEIMRRDARYRESLVHFRLAKAYGINILESLKNKDQKANVEEKYKVDLSDIRNEVYTGAKPAEAPAARQNQG